MQGSTVGSYSRTLRWYDCLTATVVESSVVVNITYIEESKTLQ